MYRVIDLTEDQKIERRHLLDHYATLAQLSVFLPLLLVQIYRFGSWIAWRKQRSTAVETASSPYGKENRASFQESRRRKIQLAFQNAYWWCGDPVEPYGLYLGTKGELIGASVWMIWLLILCFAQTGDGSVSLDPSSDMDETDMRPDYFHPTKRFGIVAASQLPVHYLLSMKSPYSPLQILTNRSHESLISIHQLLGRIIITLFYLHAIFYLSFFIVSSLLLAKLQQLYILCGVFAIIAYTVIGATSLPLVRQRSYRVFYTVHVVLASLLLPVLFFHVSHIRIYLYETALVYILSVGLRIFHTRPVSVNLTSLVENSSLLAITIPASQPHITPQAWKPGQHAYIAFPGSKLPFTRCLHSNPFSVSSIATDDGQIRFVVRVLDGNTAALARRATARAPYRHDAVPLEGPYGRADHVERLLGYDRVLFVAGGVGATFVAPIYRALLADLSPGPGAYRRQSVDFVWCVRALAETGWAVPAEEKAKAGFVERLKVYVTRDTVDETTAQDGAFVVGGEEEEEDEGEQGPSAGAEEVGIELEERKTLLAEDGKSRKSATKQGMAVHMGRPDMGKVVGQVFSHGSHERVAVVVCGPRGLSRDVRRAVGSFVEKGRDVSFWEETFAM